MKKSKQKVCVLSGEEAKASYHQGNRDPRVLSTLGFYREFEFETPEELNAFLLGFEIHSKLEEPIEWHSTTQPIEDG